MKYFIIACFVFLWTNSNAQDYIVFLTGDMVFCDIENEREDVLYIKYKHQGKVTFGTVFKSHLMTYEKNAYEGSYVRQSEESSYLVTEFKNYQRDLTVNLPNAVPDSSDLADVKTAYRERTNQKQVSNTRARTAPAQRPKREYPAHVTKNDGRIRFSANGGLSRFLIPNIDVENDPYLDDLRNGQHAGLEFGYVLGNGIGVGTSFTYFNTQALQPVVQYENPFTGQTVVDRISDNISVNFTALTIFGHHQLTPSEPISLRWDVAYGLVSYRNRGYYGENILITGQSFGSKLGLALEYGIIPETLDVGLHVHYFSSSLRKISVSHPWDSFIVDLSDSPEPLFRLDFGLSVNFWL